MPTTAVADCRILLVDDEPANLDLLEGILRGEGYHQLLRASDGRQVAQLVEAFAADLVLLDLHMPHLSGFDVLREVRARTSPDDYLPVLVLTADATPLARDRALSQGARDFLTKPFDVAEVVLRVRNLLETRLLHGQQRDARARAEAAEARATLLARASQVLGASLDAQTPMSQLSRLMVPGFADGCALRLCVGEECAPPLVTHRTPEGERALAGAFDDAGSAARLSAVLHGEHAAVLEPLDGGRAVGQAGGAGATLAAPLRSHGRTIGGLVLVRDAAGFDAEDVALAQELGARAGIAVENARLFAEAHAAREDRERLLSVVAHDLRNPLAIISMYSEMLISMRPPAEEGYEAEAARSIFLTAGRMQQLIESLLDLSRFQAGSFALDLGDEPVGALLAEAAGMLRPLAEGRGVRLHVADEIGGAAPGVRVDGTRVMQVLSNLVGNALKFTPAGGSVTVRCRRADDHVEISVADTGPGIPSDQLPHLFGAFWQANRTDRRGLGLGLWIARSIVEAHGGRIWAESRPGEGAVFRFTLPRAVAGEAQAAPMPLSVHVG